MAAYCQVYDSRHLQADYQEPGSAPDVRQSSIGYLYFFTSDYLRYLRKKPFCNPLAHPTWKCTTLTCEVPNFFLSDWRFALYLHFPYLRFPHMRFPVVAFSAPPTPVKFSHISTFLDKWLPFLISTDHLCDIMPSQNSQECWRQRQRWGWEIWRCRRQCR